MMAKFNDDLKQWESSKVPYSLPLDTFIGEEILRRLKKTPDRVLQTFHEENSEITCDKLRISSVRIAQNLIKIGIKADDVVGVICKNSNEVTFLFNACVLIGAPINPLDNSLSKDDIKHLFDLTQPKLVVCDPEALDKVQQTLQELQLDAKVYLSSLEPSELAMPNLADLLAPTGIEDEFVPEKFDKNVIEKVLAILCSSGTTGQPKGVKITHAFVMSWITLIRPKPPTKSITFSPNYWGTGFYPHILAALGVNDIKIMSNRSFSVEVLAEIVEKHQLTNLTVPPMHLAAILNSNFSQTCDHKSLKNISCVGSIVSDSLRKKFSQIFPDKSLDVFYGMTEVPISMTTPGEYKENMCVGSIILPNMILKIVDDNGMRLGVGEVGELCVKSEFKFQGYHNNKESSITALDDEDFIKTGDLGHFNHNNALFIIDRKKEVMKYKGYHITPSEIENVIEKIEGVQHVSVVGIPDEIAANLTAAVIIKRPGYKNMTDKFVINSVAGKLPVYKQLHGGVYFVDDFPKTASGKIQKRFVKEIAIKLYNEKNNLI